jgi:ribosomal protein L11 methylase PrmA
VSAPVWTQVEIEVALEAAELVADAVGEIAGGVEIRDSGTLIRADPGRAVIVALCAPERLGELLAELEAICARAREAELPVDPVVVRQREAHEDEWRDVWKKYFRATRVGQSFIVRPSWDLESLALGPADRIIDLDPRGAALSRPRLRVGDPGDRGRPALARRRRAGDRQRSRSDRVRAGEPGPQPHRARARRDRHAG